MSSLSKIHTRTKYKKRKAISDVISTLLLIAVTVSGATLLFVMVNGSNLTKSIGGVTNQNLPPQILLLGYDTRDGSNLSGITGTNGKPLLNNTLTDSAPTPSLRTSTKIQSNLSPTNGGTEYIVLRIRNAGATNIFLTSLTVNEVSHKWASTTSGRTFDPSVINDQSSPTDGKFSIISTSNTSPITQQSSLIPGSTDVRLVIKLSSAINSATNSDILNTSVIRIVLNVQNINAATTFSIPAGSAK